MNGKRLTIIALVFVVLAAGYATARPATNEGFWNTGIASHIPGLGMMGNYGGFGHGGGMMGYGADSGNTGDMMANYGNGYGRNGGMMGYGAGNGVGGGMMAGYGAENGIDCEMDGSGYTSRGYNVDTEPLTIGEATEAVEKYLESTGNPDLELKEVMEFSNNFYAEVEEESTGIHAFELLINKYTGRVTPEMGPNMMWNTKYGHMTWGDTTQEATVTEEQALNNAQAYLDRVMPGTTVAEHADSFYGYYTIHTLEDDRISGMLSVNSNTGAVWYHNWHGEFVNMLEVE